ncbi:hypothetical protein GQ457_04G007440 [Hibiscus cannabinus]
MVDGLKDEYNHNVNFAGNLATLLIVVATASIKALKVSPPPLQLLMLDHPPLSLPLRQILSPITLSHSTFLMFRLFLPPTQWHLISVY